MSGYPFVVRVYGIYFEEGKGVLVSDEYIKGKLYTKFPGGGLEFGEGTVECLRREMLEETGQEFEVLKHFYTTDFFVESAFDDAAQVISVYYLMKPVREISFLLSSEKFDFELLEGAQSFRFVELNSISKDFFTLLIDQHVAEMIRLNKGELRAKPGGKE